MGSLRRWILGLSLLVPATSAPTQEAPAPKASETQAPPVPPPAFFPTKAQRNEARVKEARRLRTEDIQALFAQAGVNYPPAQVLLRVFKADDTLELWVRNPKQKEFQLLKSYAICARSGELGPKRQRGDLQVPEGFYQVTMFHPRSQFHLSMLINYPNESDRIRATAHDPGGSILVHGACCTIGCIPITDRWIEELYIICLDSFTRHANRTLVHIFPGRLDEAGLAKLKQEFPERKDLHTFWEEIRPGFETFESTHVPAKFRVDRAGAYRF